MGQAAERGDSTLVRASAWGLAAAGVLGLLETVKAWVAGRSAPNTFGWKEAVLTNLPWWLLWGLAVPLVGKLVQAFPFRSGRWRRPLAVHAVASLLFSLVHLALSALIVWAAVSHVFQPLATQLRNLVAGYLVTDVLTYWTIVAGLTVYESNRRLAEGRRERQALEVRASRTEARAARLEADMTRARLEALRMELNPHFLFNALNSVSALARRGDVDTAVRMVSRLSELLRRTLDEEMEAEIPLDEELELLDLYLGVERLRFGDRLDVELRVDASVRRAFVPAFILQPLVENAVRHGLGAVRGALRLRVEASASDDVLDIRVRDSGPGFEVPGGPAREGVGLANTRARLAALHGPAGRLELGRAPGGGAEVRITVPLRIDEGVRVGA